MGTAVESTLEALDLATCARHTVYRTAGRIEAPNWTPGGRQFAFVSYRLAG